ncbi:MAG TPA: VanZ family protein [Vicinamibacterales bacterium]|nr:VanZ family protein [Vicinamibacterales bacterium]
MRRVWLWLPPIVYMIAIFYVSSESQPLPIVTAHVWDKLLHLTEYAGLGLLWCRALRREGCGWPSAILLAALASTLYGATDEWHQSFVPLRDSSVRDWLADLIGSTLGALLFAATGL